MVSDAAAAASSDAELARLSGSELVAHLGATCRRADYDAASRVLDARDRKLAEAEAALEEVRPALAAVLADIDALRRRYVALRDARRGPRSEAASPGGAISDPAPAPLGERRGEGADEKGGSFVELCSRDEEEWEEGEFRPHVAGVSCKRKASASPCSTDKDEDENIPLSELWKKRREAEREAGESKEEHGDAYANSVRPLGNGLPKIPPVIWERREARVGGSEEPKVANFVQGRGNGRSGKDGGMSRAMRSSPTGFAVGSVWQNNSSKVDDDGTGIGGKEGSFAGPGEDMPSHVRNSCPTAMKSVKSVRADAKTRRAHIGSAPGEIGSMVLRGAIKEQGNIDGGIHKIKVLPETSGIGDQVGILLKALREQERTSGRVNKMKLSLETNGIGENGSFQIRKPRSGGRHVTSDKPVPSTSHAKNRGWLYQAAPPVGSSPGWGLKPER